MRILIDTHVLLWWWSASPQLSARGRQLIAQEGMEVLASTASLWEVAIKAGLGRIGIPENTEAFFVQQLELNGFELIGIRLSHLAVVRTLDRHHRDPFDRMLVAQAMVEGVPLLSADSALDAYPIERIW